MIKITKNTSISKVFINENNKLTYTGKILIETEIFDTVEDLINGLDLLYDIPHIGIERLKEIYNIIKPCMSLKDIERFHEILESFDIIQKEKNRLYKAEWYKNNKDKILKKQKIYKQTQRNKVNTDEHNETEDTECCNVNENGVNIMFTEEELEMIHVLVSSQNNGSFSKIRNSILEKIQFHNNVGDINNNFTVDTNNIIPDIKTMDIFNWIEDGLYHNGRELYHLTKRALHEMEDKPYWENYYAQLTEFHVRYLIGANSFPISFRKNYKLVMKEGEIVPIGERI